MQRQLRDMKKYLDLYKKSQADAQYHSGISKNAIWKTNNRAIYQATTVVAQPFCQRILKLSVHNDIWQNSNKFSNMIQNFISTPGTR